MIGELVGGVQRSLYIIGMGSHRCNVHWLASAQALGNGLVMERIREILEHRRQARTELAAP